MDRRFNEADLRLMLENATSYHENHEEGRWCIEIHYTMVVASSEVQCE